MIAFEHKHDQNFHFLHVGVNQVIAVDQQPTAGDLVDTPACLPPRPSDQANASKWCVHECFWFR